jgi:general secretion pathway protein K
VKRRAQQGVALITVLLVMSLALLMTAGMLRSQRLSLHSNAQQIHQLQLRQLGFVGEAWGRERLRTLLPDPASPVAAGQAWAEGEPGLSLEGGRVEVDIEDLSGRFNVTALLTKGPPDDAVAQRWLRLQKQLKVPAIEATAFQGLSLSDISQLRQVPGVDAQWWARMQPWVALLDKGARLNLNTASVTLLSSLAGITPDLARRLVAERPAQGYASVEAFTFLPALRGLGIPANGLGIDSHRFRITTHVRLGQSRLRLESDVARHSTTGQWRLLQRRFLAPLHSEPHE